MQRLSNIDTQKKSGSSASDQEPLTPPSGFEEAILANMNEGLYTVNKIGSIVLMNPAAEKVLGWTLNEIRGRNIHEVVHYKRRDGSPFLSEECLALNVLKTGVPVFDNDDVFIRKDGTFFDTRFSASPLIESGEIVGMVVVFRDVTERKRVQKNNEFLFAIAERIRSSRSPETLLAEIADAVGKHLGVHRCLFNEIDLEKDTETVFSDYSRTGESVAGKHKISDYSPASSESMKRGQTVVNRNSQSDPRTAELFEKTYRPNNEVAYVAVPMLRGGKWVASLWCSDDKARDWTDEDIGLLEQIAERSWSAIERIRSEAALTRLAAIVEYSDDAMISKDLNGIITSWNSGAERLFGYKADEIIGKSVTMLMSPDRFDEEPGILERIRRGESINHYETVRRRKDGIPIDISLTVSPLYDGEGRIIGASKVARDITERKRSERTLRESQTRLADELVDTKILQKLSLELIPEQSTEVLYEQILEAAVELMKSDAASLQMLDPVSNVLNLLAWKGFHPESAPHWDRVEAGSSTTCGKALEAGQRIVVSDVETCDFLARTQDLEEYRRSNLKAMQSTPLTSRSGRPLGMLSTHWSKLHQPSGRDFNLFDILARQAADLIERLGAEAALRKSEERVRLSLEASRMGAFIWYVEEDRGEPDARMRELFGLQPEGELNLANVLGRLIHPDDREHYARAVADAIDPKGDGKLSDEIRILRESDNEERWIAITGQAEFEGEPRRAVRIPGVAADITDARRAQAALRESEEKYRLSENQLRLVTDNIPALIGYVGKDERYQFVNGAYTEWFGLPKEAFLGKKLKAILGVRAYEAVKPEVDRVLAGDTIRFETLLNYKLGGPRFVSGAYVPDLAEDGSVIGFYALSHDITELKRSEDLLRLSEERMRLLTESFTDYAIFSTDIEGRIDSWNRGAENIFGYSEDEILGSTHEILFTPEDVGRGVPVRAMRNARNTGRSSDERWYIRKGGSRFFASGVMAPLFVGRSLTGYAKIAADLTERKRTAEALQNAHDEMEVRVLERTRELAEANAALLSEINERKTIERQKVELLQRVVTTQEDERRRIARDIHDQLGQRLTALRLKIASMRELCGDNNVLIARVTRLQEISEILDSEISFLARELRPTALDELELKDAIGTFVCEWSVHYETPAEFHSMGMANLPLSGDADTHIYRIAQEALNNIAKHARATKVNVLLEKRGDEVLLIVEDDGVGFVREERKAKRGRGLGLRGMGERAALVGGRLEIESAIGNGTTIYARIPVSPKGNE